MLEEDIYTEAPAEHPTIDELIQAPVAEVPEDEDADDTPVLTMVLDHDDDEGASADDDDFIDSQDGQADAEAAAENAEVG